MQCKECEFFNYDIWFGENCCENKQIRKNANESMFYVSEDFYCKFWQLSPTHKNKLYEFADLFKEYEYPKFFLDFEVINGKLTLVAFVESRELLALNLLNIIKNKNEWVEAVQVRASHV